MVLEGGLERKKEKKKSQESRKGWVILYIKNW